MKTTWKVESVLRGKLIALRIGDDHTPPESYFLPVDEARELAHAIMAALRVAYESAVEEEDERIEREIAAAVEERKGGCGVSRESMAAMADDYRKRTQGWGYRFQLGNRVEGVDLLRDGHAGMRGVVVEMFHRSGTNHYRVRWDDGTESTHYGESLYLRGEGE